MAFRHPRNGEKDSCFRAQPGNPSLMVVVYGSSALSHRQPQARRKPARPVAATGIGPETWVTLAPGEQGGGGAAREPGPLAYFKALLSARMSPLSALAVRAASSAFGAFRLSRRKPRRNTPRKAGTRSWRGPRRCERKVWKSRRTVSWICESGSRATWRHSRPGSSGAVHSEARLPAQPSR